MPKTWTKPEIKSLLKTNGKAVKRGVLAIYSLQTGAEQSSFTTHAKNGVGFNAYDAEIMTDAAEEILKYGEIKDRTRYFQVRARLMKYAGQLTQIANKQI